MRQVQVNPSIINTHNSLLMAGNKMRYPINKIDTQMFTISQGKQSDRIVIKINQQLPKRPFFAFVDHEAKNGSLDKNPFNFQHFLVSSICLDVDGVPVPSKPIETNFTRGLYARPFFNLAQATGKAFNNIDHGITREKFANGYAVFAFDLTPDQCIGEGVHLISNGTVTLEVSFRTALTATILVFMFAERDNLIELDHQRVVTRLSRL
jgi:ribonucleoside-diphosphate reductase beta chain